MSEAEEKGKKKMDKEEEGEEEEPEDKKKKKKEKSEVSDEMQLSASEIVAQLAALVKPEKRSEPHPLDESVAHLKAVYDEALSIDFTPEESLQLIQEPFNELGNLVRDNVTNKPSGEPESVEGSEGKAVARALSAIADRLEGLEQTQNMIQAQLSSGGVGVPNQVPPRRSYQPPVQRVPPELAAKQSVSKSSTPNLRSIVNKTVGI
jgi:hypothetical protein